jgi:hypothetical protein
MDGRGVYSLAHVGFAAVEVMATAGRVVVDGDGRAPAASRSIAVHGT